MVPVLCHCVKRMKAEMEFAHSVEEDGPKFDIGVGCKAKGKSTAVAL